MPLDLVDRVLQKEWIRCTNTVTCGLWMHCEYLNKDPSDDYDKINMFISCAIPLVPLLNFWLQRYMHFRFNLHQHVIQIYVLDVISCEP